ncbi:MAG: hypothetical protein NTX86_03330 [Candidatus Dependentiae bacterium]|nr:hypothetical protein [Candidatus Dependentiae bacterium]
MKIGTTSAPMRVLYALVFIATTAHITICATEKKVDLIIFSFDRPLQLHALLSSIEQYVTEFNEIHVLLRCSNSSYQAAYYQIKSQFPHVKFAQQGSLPKKDFKPLMLNCFNSSDAPYIAFSTDDLVINDYINTNQCLDALESINAYGFYLRLGNNITYSYNRDIPLVVPPLTHITDDIYAFNFKDGISYWAYPNSVDIVIYKKADIKSALTTLHYTSPNILESRWARNADTSGFGLCFKYSKGFNIPLNLVQDDWYNKNSAIFTPQELLDLWNQNMKMDLVPFHQAKNISATMAYVPTFITRNKE